MKRTRAKIKMRANLPPLLLCVFLLSGCASAPFTFTPSQSSKTIEIKDPPLDKVVTKNLGDSVASSGSKTSKQALAILSAVQFGVTKKQTGNWLQCVPTATPQTLFETINYNGPKGISSCFGPTTFLRTEQDGDQNPLTCMGSFGVGYVCRDNGGNFFLPLGNLHYDLLRDTHLLSLSQVDSKESPSFVQEFVYNGRAGDTLKFIYREFANELIRPAFTQEVQYDLTQSSEVGFKTLRLEVVSATNTSITYLVTHHF